MLGISRSTLEREIKRYRLPFPLKIGSTSLYSFEDLTRYVRQLESERTAAGGLPPWMKAEEDAKKAAEETERIATQAKKDQLLRESYGLLNQPRRHTSNDPNRLP